MSYALQQLGFNPVGESLIVNLEPVTGDAALMHSLFVVGIEDGLVRLADGRINNKKSNPSNWNEWPGIKFDEATQTYTMPLDTLLDGLYSVQSVTYQNPGTLASELELSDYQATIQKMIEQSTLPSNQTEVDGLSTTLDSEANVTNIDFRTIVYESEINQELTRKLNDLGLERQVVFSEIVNDYIELQATPEGQAIIQNEYMPYLDSGKQYQADFFPVNNDDERSHAVGAFTHYITARMAQEKDVNGNRLFPDEMIESDQFKAGVDVITQQLGIYKKDISFKQFIQCVANVYMSIVLDPVDDQLNLPQLPLEDANQVFSIMNEYGLSREGGKGFMDAWEDGDEIHGQYVYSSNNGSWAAWNVDTAAEFKNGDLVFFGLNHVIRIQRVYNTENGVVIAYTQANDPRVLYDSTEISTTKGVPEVTLVSERSFLDFVGPLEDVLILRSEISSNVPNSISTPTPIIEFVSNTSTTP